MWKVPQSFGSAPVSVDETVSTVSVRTCSEVVLILIFFLLKQSYVTESDSRPTSHHHLLACSSLFHENPPWAIIAEGPDRVFIFILSPEGKDGADAWLSQSMLARV